MKDKDFERIVKRYDKLINFICGKYHLNGLTFEDKKQECLSALWSVMDRYDPEYKISTFISTVCKNNFNNLWRKQRKENEISNGGIVYGYDFENQIDEDVIYTPTINFEQFDELLQGYSKKHIIEPIFYNGKSQRQVAKEMKYSQPYVNQVFKDFKRYIKENWKYENNE